MDCASIGGVTPRNIDDDDCDSDVDVDVVSDSTTFVLVTVFETLTAASSACFCCRICSSFKITSLRGLPRPLFGLFASSGSGNGYLRGLPRLRLIILPSLS